MNKLIQKAEERFEENWGMLSAYDIEGIKSLLKTELETIVKESFKNTRVTRRTKDGECLICGEATEECTCQIALSDKHNKEKTFLGE